MANSGKEKRSERTNDDECSRRMRFLLRLFLDLLGFFFYFRFLLFFFRFIHRLVNLHSEVKFSQKISGEEIAKGQILFFLKKKTPTHPRLCMSLVTRKKLNIELAGAGMMSCAQ